MGIYKKICLMLLLIIVIIGISNYVLANNENITYKAEYNDAISYKITITGLEYDSNYTYEAIICQKDELDDLNFAAVFGKSFSINYNNETGLWEGTTLVARDGVKAYAPFEKAGQYYICIARAENHNWFNCEIIDGPREIETPDLPPLGKRMNIYASYDSTSCHIEVNALNTMLHNGVQRTIRFYVGEVTDTELLKKLSENKEASYDELLQYAKEQLPNLQEDSFQDTKTGILDYNIVADYPIENGKYYFLYSILDNENGTYVDVEDIEIYNGKRSSQGVRLANFEYTVPEEESSININNNIINTNNDSTTANKILPKAGISIAILLILIISIICMILLYLKNKKYKIVK